MLKATALTTAMFFGLLMTNGAVAFANEAYSSEAVIMKTIASTVPTLNDKDEEPEPEKPITPEE